MRCKIISFFMCLFISTSIMCKSNKIEIIDNKTESKYTSKQKLTKKIKPKKKVIKKSKKEKELEYWSKVTGKKVIKVTKINANLSFYTDLDCENGYGNVDCRGNKLEYGTIANNYYPLNTNVYIPGYGNMVINDKGSKKLQYNNFDIFIPREQGDTDKEYFNKVNNLGIKNVNCYIFKFKEE